VAPLPSCFSMPRSTSITVRGTPLQFSSKSLFRGTGKVALRKMFLPFYSNFLSTHKPQFKVSLGSSEFVWRRGKILNEGHLTWRSFIWYPWKLILKTENLNQQTLNRDSNCILLYDFTPIRITQIVMWQVIEGQPEVNSQWKRFFSLPEHSDKFWCLPSLLFNG
jgi:hypothetical protein